MRWLITGGCGFIGRSLVARLLAEGGHSIRVLDNLSVGGIADLESVVSSYQLGGCAWSDQTVGLFKGDIRDRAIVTASINGADIVVHLAANTGVAPSVEDPYGDCDANVIGTLNMLEAARGASVRKFVFASSGAPLGVQEPPLHEGLAPHPASPYGASKLAGEGYCSAYYHCFGVETVALRFGNVYGPRSGHKMSVVAKFIKQALDNKSWEIYGDGGQTRDFIYIDDLIDAVYLAATTPDIGGETFQIATSRETTLNQLARALSDALVAIGQKEPVVNFGPRRQGDVESNYSDARKAETVLKWRAKTKLADGLLATVKFFVKK